MRRLFLRILPVILTFTLHSAFGQPVESHTNPQPVRIPASSQDYFLLQPFHARDAADRRPLYHIGMLVETVVDGYVVGAVLDGFPAQQAGLRRGDRLLRVDGEPFHPIASFNPQNGDAQKGPGAMSRQLQFTRNGADRSVELTPVFGNLYDALRTATLNSSQQISNGNKIIGYLKLWSLDRSTDGLQTFGKLIAALDHCDGLVLDIRDAYGFAGPEHLDHFFASRSSYPVVTGAEGALWTQAPAPRINLDRYDRPMVLIQNAGTRGSIEIFAHQLAKADRVISIGQATSGKAGQVSLEDANVLIYTPASEATVDGMVLEGRGVEPEREVNSPISESAPNDPQLEAALLTLMSIL